MNQMNALCTIGLSLAFMFVAAGGAAKADEHNTEEGHGAEHHDQTHNKVETLCLATVRSYFIVVDANDADAAAALFTDSAIVTLTGDTLNGASGVRDYFKNRPSSTRLMHHMTTHRIVTIDERKARGDIYVLIHGETMLESETGEMQKEAGLFSVIYRDEYVIEDGVCKITKRTLEPRTLTRV